MIIGEKLKSWHFEFADVEGDRNEGIVETEVVLKPRAVKYKMVGGRSHEKVPRKRIRADRMSDVEID